MTNGKSGSGASSTAASQLSAVWSQAVTLADRLHVVALRRHGWAVSCWRISGAPIRAVESGELPTYGEVGRSTQNACRVYRTDWPAL